MKNILLLSIALIFSLLLLSSKCSDDSISPSSKRILINFDEGTWSGSDYMQNGFTFTITNGGLYSSASNCYRGTKCFSVNHNSVGYFDITAGGTTFDVHSLYFYNCNCSVTFYAYKEGSQQTSQAVTIPNQTWTKVTLNFTDIDRLGIDLNGCSCIYTRRLDDIDVTVY